MIFLSIFFFILASTNAFRFLHITDIHMDTGFRENTADNCLLHQTGMPCCRQYQIKKEPYKLVSKWGSTTCDTSPLLLEKSLEWISAHVHNIDFILRFLNKLF